MAKTDRPAVTRWRWTITGLDDPSGTIVRAVEEHGEVDAEGAGDAIDAVLRSGPWDLVDQEQAVTVHVEPLGPASR